MCTRVMQRAQARVVMVMAASVAKVKEVWVKEACGHVPR